MAFLIGVRYLAGPYLALAESVGWEWLEKDGSEVVVMKFGEDIIGTLIFAVVSEAVKGKKKRKRGVFRAWTIRRRERRRGCGRGVLEEGVKVLSGRGVEGVSWEEDGICESFLSWPSLSLEKNPSYNGDMLTCLCLL